MVEGRLNLKTPKLSQSMNFYDLWSKISNPIINGFLNKICFLIPAPDAEK